MVGRYRTAHYGKWHLGCTDDAPAVNAYGYDDSVTYVSNPNNSKQVHVCDLRPLFFERKKWCTACCVYASMGTRRLDLI